MPFYLTVRFGSWINIETLNIELSQVKLKSKEEHEGRKERNNHNNHNKHSMSGIADLRPGHGGLITEPNPNDVLSGRGGRINSHTGNLQFRQLVNQYKHEYLSKQTKKLDKVKIAGGIVQTIRTMNPPGRFLKQQDKGKDNWVEIGDEKARKKAGQAMREKADETRKELQHQHQHQHHAQQQQQFGISPGGSGQSQDMDVSVNSNVAMQNHFHNMQQQMQMQSQGSQFNNNYGMGYQQQQHQQQPPGRFSPSNSTIMSNSSFPIPTMSNSSFPNPTMSNSSFPPNSTSSGQAYSQTSQQPGSTSFLANMSPLQIQQYTEEQRRMHASILKGNAVAFDREFHRMRSSDSSGSRVNSLDARNNSSNSSSSMMSALSSGVLSQSELLHLALQQQQQQLSLSNHNQMAVVDETNEWNNNNTNTSPTRTGTGPSGVTGAGSGAGTVASGSGSGLSGSASSGENNRRRMFQQSRGQSYLEAAEGAGAGNQHQQSGLHASQLMRASLGTVGSMNMGMGMGSGNNMSSMGMGSSNMMSSMNSMNMGMGVGVGVGTGMNMGSTNSMRSQNMQRRMSALGIDLMTTSDTSLMNLLADAAANSSVSTPATSGMVQSSTRPSPSPTQGTNTAPVPATPTNPNNNTINMAVSDAANINFEPIALNNNFQPGSVSGSGSGSSSKPPDRELTRGGSSKSDVSMASNGSWYNTQVRNLGSMRNLVNVNGEMNDSRLRLFSENSAR